MNVLFTKEHTRILNTGENPVIIPQPLRADNVDTGHTPTRQQSRHAALNPISRSDLRPGFTTGPNQRTSSEPQQQQHQGGQVPQTGLELARVQAVVPESKPDGAVVILVTHQPERFWLKAGASKNIEAMTVASLVSQLLMS